MKYGEECGGSCSSSISSNSSSCCCISFLVVVVVFCVCKTTLQTDEVKNVPCGTR